MNNTVFGKTMGNVRKHTDIKFVKKERKRNYLVSEPNYHTTDFFSEMLLVTEIWNHIYVWINLSIKDF